MDGEEAAFKERGSGSTTSSRTAFGGGGERTGGLAVCFFLVKMLDSRMDKKEDLKRAKQAVKMK